MLRDGSNESARQGRNIYEAQGLTGIQCLTLQKVWCFFEFFDACFYIPDTNIKNSRLWQQQFLQVQRTSSQRFVSTSPTKESSLPHHSTTGSMPSPFSNSPTSKSSLSSQKWPNTSTSHPNSRSLRLLLPKFLLDMLLLSEIMCIFAADMNLKL